MLDFCVITGAEDPRPGGLLCPLVQYNTYVKGA